MVPGDDARRSAREAGDPGPEPPLVRIAGVHVRDVGGDLPDDPGKGIDFELVEPASVHGPVDGPGREHDVHLRPEGTEPGLGPQRTVYAATGDGQAAAQRWLHEPVEHVREIRSALLLKLALLNRADEDPAGLLRAQRAVLEPLVGAIESRRAGSQGFDATLLAWRRANAAAALEFIDIITPDESRQP